MSGPRIVGVIAIVLLSMSFAHRSEAADLTVAWNPPTDGVTVGYVLYYGTMSGSYSQQVNVGAVTSYTVSGLAAGTNYYFAVRAYDAVADLSDFSAEVSAMTDSPSVMTGLALASSRPSPQVAGTTVTWSATPTGGVAPYEFQWSVYHAGQWTVGSWTSASTWTWTPNAAGNDYYVRVAALSSGSTSTTGDMAQTAPFTITAPPASATCPGPDPFAAMGGGTCFNGGWYPPSGAPAPTPTPTPPTPAPTGATCTTPDPFTSIGGGTCFNGGWYPPGAPAPTPTPAPTPPTSTLPPTPAPTGATCTTPNPFVAFGMGVCVNGGWQFAAPATPQLTPPPPPPSAGGCRTPDPFVGIPGLHGVCVNGGWYPIRG